jgi:hypothetical protein
MNTNRLKECSAPSAKLVIPLSTMMGSGVRVVDLSLYHLIRDTQRTFRLSGPCAPVPSLACAQQQKQAQLVHSVRVVGDLGTRATAFTKTVSGFVEVVSRAF